MAPLRVLLIDDEEELVSTLAERLKLRGIAVEGVTSGADAFGHFQEKKFDVVVLDMKMPGIGGLEVMRRIRKEQPGVKFVLMTGRGSLEEGEEGMKEGASAYLLKPINIEDLIEKMMEAVRV
jgi:DNA-binding NtrC family response regulator